jgi:hypothetical protein
MTSPAHKIRIGTLQATIWRNLNDKGNWYSVKLTRGYKADEGWRETDNFGSDDLLPAAKLLDMSHTSIMHQLEADKKGRKQDRRAVPAQCESGQQRRGRRTDVAHRHSRTKDQHRPHPRSTRLPRIVVARPVATVPKQEEAFRQELGRLLEERRNRPIDWDAINRQQREQSTRMAVMLAFLDQQVSPSPGPEP